MSEPPSAQRPAPPRSLWAGLLKLLGVAFLIASAVFAMADGRGLAFIAWAREAGVAGAVLFGLVYVLATVLMLPGSLLTLGAGAIYGPLWGILLISPASVAGAAAAFLLARGALRPWVEERVTRDARFAAIDRAIGNAGFKITFLVRLSPVLPFNLLNYALGVTSVSFANYVLASFIGMLPGTFLYVVSGSLAHNLAELSSAGPEGTVRLVFLGFGLLITLLLSVGVARLARRALREEAGTQPAEVRP